MLARLESLDVISTDLNLDPRHRSRPFDVRRSRCGLRRSVRQTTQDARRLVDFRGWHDGRQAFALFSDLFTDTPHALPHPFDDASSRFKRCLTPSKKV
ncbi:hypothetical protein GR157_11145 [Burkholderia sp. 4701]|nr:hypothetical protein [Burkholderia sp. 4701]MXN82518.1 hypothetical protein [Burkholderia sp. 4812]